MTHGSPTGTIVDAAAAADRIRVWGESRDWCGWDPYDGLNSPYNRALSFGTPLGRRLLTQAVKLSPVNLRPLLGISPARNHKAIGLVASAYAQLGTHEATARRLASRWLDWLEREHVGENGCAWGYHFDVQTRFFSYPAGSPNTIATAFVAQSFLDGAELLGDERRLEVAGRAARFLVDEMYVDGERGPFFRYVPQDTKLIHNANLLACAVLVRLARLGGDEQLRDIARSAIATSVDAQRDDGSWPYSEWGGNEWVDNFHTGYVLESLAHCHDVGSAAEALRRGVMFWSQELFSPEGEPKLFPDRPWPLDAHCYAQAIDTWLALPEQTETTVAHAENLARLFVRDMLEPSGAVVFQRRRYLTNRVPFVRWTAAPSFRALARLARVQRLRSEA